MITELETINKMLSASGLAPVADANTQHPYYRKGRLKLNEVSRIVQSAGHWFNTSTQTLIPTVDGSVYVPNQAVHVNTTESSDSQIVIRGSRMYDLEGRTYTISRELPVHMVELLPFNELPAPAADYIAARAVHEFYLEQGGQEPKLSEFRGIRQVAEIEFKKERVKNHRPLQPTYTRSRSRGLLPLH